MSFIVTVPGVHGAAVAFDCEWLISFGLMPLILVTSNHRRWAALTGLLCGALIALYVTFESPFSGMSMNPARTVASAFPGEIWRAGWIYFIAPTSAMIGATLRYRSATAVPRMQCAKLNHGGDGDCIFVCDLAEAGATTSTARLHRGFYRKNPIR